MKKISFILLLYLGSLGFPILSTYKRVRVHLKVPEYWSRFPSMGLSSQVRVHYKQLQYIKVPQVRIQVQMCDPSDFVKKWVFLTRHFFREIP